MKVMVTGASGFVGTKLCPMLTDAGYDVVPVIRSRQSDPATGTHNAVFVNSIDAATDWTSGLADIDVVVHLAARVHVMDDFGPDVLSNLREINVEGTRNLAEQAARSGVKRLIYISAA